MKAKVSRMTTKQRELLYSLVSSPGDRCLLTDTDKYTVDGLVRRGWAHLRFPSHVTLTDKGQDALWDKIRMLRYARWKRNPIT